MDIASKLKRAVLGCVVAVPAFLVACHSPDARDDQGPGEHQRLEFGKLELPLSGSSESGVTYQLRGVFQISGAVTEAVNTEDYLGEYAAEVELPTGNYDVELADGWSLQRLENGQESPVDALLISENPTDFQIRRDRATEVLYRFRVGDEIVVIRRGSLVLKIAVDDSDLPVVDTNLEPSTPWVEGLGPKDPRRRVAALLGSEGKVMSFVEKELVVSGLDGDALQELLARVDGELVKTIEPFNGGSDAEAFHLVRIGAVEGSPEEIANRIDPAESGPLTFSSNVGMSSFAIALTEAADFGVQVTPNWVLTTAELPDREIAEAPTGDPIGGALYSPNPFDWPYMQQGGPLDIGTAEAWRALDAHGITTRVPIMVIDGGFRRATDLPADTVMIGNRWDIENPSDCGEEECPWHGTNVARVLAGRVDNDWEAAGSGGLVVQPYLVQAPSFDVFQIASLLGDIVTGLDAGPDIVNLSGGFWIDQWICDNPFSGPFCWTLEGFFAGVRAAGVLVVASAGNGGDNIGGAAFYVPCEASGVLCVGGMQPDSPQIALSSNYSYASSVDIYAPFDVWYGSDPTNLATNYAQMGSGTSYSSPYIAGVLGLMRAADPGLSIDELEDILKDTAHRGSSPRVSSPWVDAFAAVEYCLGGEVPPFVEITAPLDGDSRPRRVTFTELRARVEVAPASAVVWTIDGEVVATGAEGRVLLPVGTHEIVATATVYGLSHSDSVTVYRTNESPEVTIVSPVTGSEYVANQAISFLGDSSDPNEDTGMLAESQVSWTIDGDSYGSGYALTVPANALSEGTHLVTFSGSDGELSDSTSINVVVLAPAADPPPAIASLSPPDGTDLGWAETLIGGNWYAPVTLSAVIGNDSPINSADIVWTTTYTEPNTGDVINETLGTGATLATNLIGLCNTIDHVVKVTVIERDDSGAVLHTVVGPPIRIRVRLFC
jgi:serine protease